MARFDTLVTPALVFEEILSDGSTLTNPAADSRKLFLGEDGLLHLRDSAGTVTDVGAGGGYTPGGTDVAVADGGTGASTAAAARTNLGLVIGTDVQAFDADIPTVAGSQGEMEAGTEAALRSMSPLRVAQAIAALAAGGGAHAASHEDGGADEIDVTGLVGAGAPADILDIPTAETDDSLVLAPDGAGGVEFRAEAGGGGGAAVLALDDITLHGTYGDHFAAAPVDAKWTFRGITANNLVFENSYVRSTPFLGDNFGMLEPWTPTTEAEFQMAAAPFYGSEDQYGLGLAVLDSAGTGIWLGSRETSRMGIFAVTTYAIADEPSSNNSLPGDLFLAEGRKAWWALTKRGARYTWRYSLNGEIWSTHDQALIAYTPSAFTPSQFGWLSGLVATTKHHLTPVDWINVTEYSLGNNLMVTPTSGTVTPTAAATTGGAVGDVIDGSDSDEWYAVGSTNPLWWQAVFSVAQSMNRIRISSRGDLWGAGYIEFSDGSTVPFYAAASGWTFVDFPTKSTTLVKVFCLRQGHGANPGLQEVEAYLAS